MFAVRDDEERKGEERAGEARELRAEIFVCAVYLCNVKICENFKHESKLMVFLGAQFFFAVSSEGDVAERGATVATCHAKILKVILLVGQRHRK